MSTIASNITSCRNVWYHMQAREEAFRSLESKYVVVRGVDPKERFGRIIVSKTMISDHSCPRYIKGLSLALSSCPNS